MVISDSMHATLETEICLPLPCVLKATPKMEAGQRMIFCEPSNEATDLDGERVLREALKESRDYFLAKGNFDLDHLSIIGYQKGFSNPRLFEIGKPLDVSFEANHTFVKGLIYQGEGEPAKCANEFWDSLTKLTPPMSWYPSVGGHVRNAGLILPKGESAPVKAIQRVYWNNIGFSREPVNQTVPGVSIMPLGTFAKSWIGAGSTLQYESVEKAITAGYGTDLATLEGGAALRAESLDARLKDMTVGQRLWRALKAGAIKSQPSMADGMVGYLVSTQGMSQDEAIQHVRSFMAETAQRKERVYATR